MEFQTFSVAIYSNPASSITIKSKVAGVTQDIVSAISYNGYGQISQLTYGNGTITDYSYATGNTKKATTLMGSTVNAKEQGTSAFTPVLSRTYTYNKQGMVAQMNRNVAGSLLSQVGNASFTDAYTYDQFGRLDSHAQSKGAASIYSLDMQYNQAGGITFKTSNGSGFMNASALNYDLLYSYSGNYGHQLERIDDPVNASTTYCTYNTSGSITQIDDPSQAIAQNFFWNEQQQLTGVSNQQGVHHYVYDHSGERIMKSSLINSKVYLNDQVIDDVSNLEPYTVYVNPYYVVTGLMGGDRVSKHYYMNQQRVATDITINYDPNGTGGGQQEQSLAKDPASAAPELSPALADFNEVLFGLGQKPLDTASLKLPTIESYYPEAAKTPATSSSAEGNPSAPRILFWYHPDYLGNVDLITERDGYTHEFFMYNPWGEEMHQWNANTYAFTSPYRFNAKELDPETGLAYYGARYYQNKIGVWLSVDPLAQKYPSFSPFCHAVNNPAFFVDPNGAESIEFDDIRFRDEHGNLLATYKTSQIDKDVVVKGTGDVGSSPNLNLNTLAESLPDVDVIGVGIIGDFTFAGGASGAIEGVLNLDGIDRGKASTHGVVSGNLGFAGGIAVYGLAMDFVGAKGDSQLTMNDYDGQSFSYSLGLMAGGSIVWSVESEKSIEFYPGQSGANRTWNGVQLYGPIVNLAIPMPKIDCKWSINKTSRIN